MPDNWGFVVAAYAIAVVAARRLLAPASSDERERARATGRASRARPVRAIRRERRARRRTRS